MELKYQSQIESIDNCPLDNLLGEKILFRCVENPMTPKSFEPYAALNKAKFKDNCLAWGLSMFSDLKSAKEILKNLSQNKKQKVNLSSIAYCKLTDNDGIKHNSKNRNHYTFYPKKDFDLIDKFAIVDENGK